MSIFPGYHLIAAARNLVLLALLLLSGAAQAKTLLVLGDSLSAGYGIDIEQGWVQLLQDRLDQRGDFTVVNASIGGETTGGGLARLPDLLKEFQPDLVIVELGGNDGLRGHPIKLIRRNLTAMVELNRAAGAATLLVGIQIPPNYGARYTRQFSAVFPQVAEELSLPLVPFFLDKVALREGAMQSDGIHPNTSAQPQMLDNVWPYLEPML
ncbi:arylesterase [Exilibacterium tricleocarpae]|uniref:Arylesterase n=1 Tax=Exilibacterium tricleocarpae TaxID=2591008 RepID=A0A545TND9_9GAMM|nr:arylesterase [Exilibacterium tricleocarpae]TQV78698.1 arylesterase [Exilibacterium tricleocarpae]